LIFAQQEESVGEENDSNEEYGQEPSKFTNDLQDLINQRRNLT
jgi:hypothetical protein